MRQLLSVTVLLLLVDIGCEEERSYDYERFCYLWANCFVYPPQPPEAGIVVCNRVLDVGVYPSDACYSCVVDPSFRCADVPATCAAACAGWPS